MSNLTRFLVDLATNAELRTRYAADPGAAFDAAGLTEIERSAFTSGDSGQMRAALGKSDNDCMSQTGAMNLPVGTKIVTLSGKVRTVCEDSILRLKLKTPKKAKKAKKSKKRAGART